VDVNPNYNFLVAIVSLKKEKLNQYCEVNGLRIDIYDLQNNPTIQHGILQ
jgi:hypothetical protein